MALTRRLNSDWLEVVGVATELAPSAEYSKKSRVTVQMMKVFLKRFEFETCLPIFRLDALGQR